MKIYKSKISSLVLILVALPMTALMLLMIWQDTWLGFSIVAITSIFLFHLFLTTYYIIDGGQLSIRSGFLVNIKIEISSISKVMKSNSFLSSPATSFDRIEIRYNKFDSVIISPSDKSAFTEALKNLNPSIEVKLE
ncbi:PH domain-containing protein [Chryseotalea sanaruensis]|nr:PH domain-containing protein [Chryseotalea sanaruensis]